MLASIVNHAVNKPATWSSLPWVVFGTLALAALVFNRVAPPDEYPVADPEMAVETMAADEAAKAAELPATSDQLALSHAATH